MIELRVEEPEGARLDDLSLGQVLFFRIGCDDPDTETRAFLRHLPVVYPRPLADWSRERRLGVFPEAPGRYVLQVEWRIPAESPEEARRGMEEVEFLVGGERQDRGPHRARVVDDLELWAPSHWESDLLRRSEHDTLDLLAALVTPSSVVYDIGANIGVYSCPIARRLGPEGHLYSVEANPVCVHFLRSNFLALGLENATILPVALLDEPGTSQFLLNYGNANLGLSERSGFYRNKLGHEIGVPCYRFDDLLEGFRLRAPDVIKIDIEGAEHLAAAGMRQTLDTSRPLVVMEIHGIDCLRATLQVFDACGYRYYDPGGRDELADLPAVEERFGDSVFQLVGRPEERRLPLGG